MSLEGGRGGRGKGEGRGGEGGREGGRERGGEGREGGERWLLYIF